MAFIIRFTGEQGRLPSLAQLVSEAEKCGAQVRTEGSHGSFSLLGVMGTFAFEDEAINLTITRKPFLFSEALIRRAITSRLSALGTDSPRARAGGVSD